MKIGVLTFISLFNTIVFMSKKYIFSVSGVRGILGKTLSIDDIFNISKAFAIFAKRYEGDKIMVAIDGRITGEMIKHIVISSLLSEGYDVIDAGKIPTPTLLLNVRKLKLKGGIIITASHNPIEWNGLKLVSNKGMFLTPDEIKEVKNILDNKELKTDPMQTSSQIMEDKYAIKRHIDEILSSEWIDVEKIREKSFNVVIDTVNASPGNALPVLLKELNCSVKHINQEVTGRFARGPEPIKENLKMISQSVKENNADIGMATDPDGDRLSLINEKGISIGEEFTLPIAAIGIIDKINGFVINYSTSSMTEFLANKYNLPIFRSKVGEINVVNRMMANGINFGGEGNGGVIAAEINPTRDSLVAAAFVLNTMAKKNKTLSEIADEFPKYKMIKRKYPLKDEIPVEKIETLLDYTKKETEDGYRYTLKDGWVHIRKSNTEPIIRVIAESENNPEEILNKIEEII